MMLALLGFGFAILALPFKSKIRLEAENTALRHQLIVLRRQVRGRVRLRKKDRLLFVQLYRWFPSILKVLTIVRPETLSGGIEPAFATIGAGNHACGEGARKLRRICAR